MKRLLRGILGAVLVSSVFGLAYAADDAPAEKKETAAAKATPTCYVCDKCCTLAMQPGACSMCKGDMKPCHVMAIKDGVAYCCKCGADCKCEMKSTDPMTCSCGKDLVKVPLKGMYVCPCNADCKCNTVSDKPGKCGCGKDLEQVK